LIASQNLIGVTYTRLQELNNSIEALGRDREISTKKH